MKIIQTSREALPPAPLQASQSGRLTIAVLGGLHLGQGDATLPLPNRKAQAILAYLALEASPAIARERLAGLFWSESSERHARSSLRQTLFEVREVLKQFGITALRTGREDVSFDRDCITLDIDLALDAIAGGTLPARLLSADSGPEMLLAGYEDLSPSFADWLATARAAALAKMLRALERGYRVSRGAQWRRTLGPGVQLHRRQHLRNPGGDRGQHRQHPRPPGQRCRVAAELGALAG